MRGSNARPKSRDLDENNIVITSSSRTVYMYRDSRGRLISDYSVHLEHFAPYRYADAYRRRPCNRVRVKTGRRVLCKNRVTDHETIKKGAGDNDETGGVGVAVGRFVHRLRDITM